MKKISLTKGKFALIDDADYDFVNQWKWSFDGSYAVRGHYLGNINGKDKYKKIYLHRVINETLKGFETDHINKNKLDNRRCNLRSATKGQNSRNHNAHKNNITGICGVVWNNNVNKYRVRITVNKKIFNLGYFNDINKAIKVRIKAEKKYYAI
jgi:hypothetical protein